MTRFLSPQEILLIHSMVLDASGGLHGLRDRGRIESVSRAPRQMVAREKLYPTIWGQAAVYIHNIIFDHPFVDGNKRTAMMAGLLFLELNGEYIRVPRGEVKRFALRIIRRRLSIDEIAAWLESHQGR